VVVADLSIVAPRPGGAGGLTNGCVAVEWGWAEEALGSEALVGVMNVHFGTVDQLPIDIRQNLVRVTYDLAPDGSDAAEVREVVITGLAKQIAAAIRARFFRGFSAAAPEVVRFFVLASQDGCVSYETFGVGDVAERAGVSQEGATAAMEDLVAHGLAEVGGGAGGGFSVYPRASLYVRFDPLFMDWNADVDARAIARLLVEREEVRIDALAGELQWSPRRMNPAVARLVQSGFVDESDEASGSSPFESVSISANVYTRSFADGRAGLPSVAPRAVLP
jgi:hypothetical protein